MVREDRAAFRETRPLEPGSPQRSLAPCPTFFQVTGEYRPSQLANVRVSCRTPSEPAKQGSVSPGETAANDLLKRGSRHGVAPRCDRAPVFIRANRGLQILEARVGIEPERGIENTQVVDSTRRQTRENCYNLPHMF